MRERDTGDMKVQRAAASGLRGYATQLVACVSALQMHVADLEAEKPERELLLRLRSDWVNTGTVIEYLVETHTAFGVSLAALQTSWQEYEAKYPARQSVGRRIRQDDTQPDPQVREQERANWIQQFGSDYLRLLARRGYEVERVYAVERAAREHPGYVVDMDSNAKYRACTTPSHLALVAAEEVNARVVWLESLPYDEEREDDDDYTEHLMEVMFEFEEGEGILIDNYLGMYDLLKPVAHGSGTHLAPTPGSDSGSRASIIARRLWRYIRQSERMPD